MEAGHPLPSKRGLPSQGPMRSQQSHRAQQAWDYRPLATLCSAGQGRGTGQWRQAGKDGRRDSPMRRPAAPGAVPGRGCVTSRGGTWGAGVRPCRGGLWDTVSQGRMPARIWRRKPHLPPRVPADPRKAAGPTASSRRSCARLRPAHSSGPPRRRASSAVRIGHRSRGRLAREGAVGAPGRAASLRVLAPMGSGGRARPSPPAAGMTPPPGSHRLRGPSAKRPRAMHPLTRALDNRGCSTAGVRGDASPVRPGSMDPGGSDKRGWIEKGRAAARLASKLSHSVFTRSGTSAASGRAVVVKRLVERSSRGRRPVGSPSSAISLAEPPPPRLAHPGERRGPALGRL